jgi:hypothetical protein
MKSAILFLVLFAMPLQGQKPATTPQPDQGRYQLLPVTLGEHGGTPQLFLFDSQTGRVWHYRSDSMQGTLPKSEFTPEAFIPVPIWKANGQQVTPESN